MDLWVVAVVLSLVAVMMVLLVKVGVFVFLVLVWWYWCGGVIVAAAGGGGGIIAGVMELSLVALGLKLLLWVVTEALVMVLVVGTVG